MERKDYRIITVSDIDFISDLFKIPLLSEIPEVDGSVNVFCFNQDLKFIEEYFRRNSACGIIYSIIGIPVSIDYSLKSLMEIKYR